MRNFTETREKAIKRTRQLVCYFAEFMLEEEEKGAKQRAEFEKAKAEGKPVIMVSCAENNMVLNSVFNDVRYPLAQAAKDGWLPKFILKENRFGAPYLIYTYTLIVVLIPIVTDMSIVTITNIFQVITFFMNVTVVYAISRLPKRYPEAWAKNKFHFSNGALYTFCTVSIIIYTVIFVKGIFSIKVSYAVAAVIVMLALILIGIYLTKKGGIRIETSLWDPSVKKEEK